MEEWVDTNKEFILNSLYEGLADFIETNEELRLVLKLVVRKNGHIRLSKFNSLAFEFLLVREELMETMEGMLRHFESIEEYEKCAELVKLKKKYLDSIEKPKKKASRKKLKNN